MNWCIIKCYQNFIKNISQIIFKIKKLYSNFQNYIQTLKNIYSEFKIIIIFRIYKIGPFLQL
jgi:hypothetical protein